MADMNFIARKFQNTKTNDIVDFGIVVDSSDISVILGEPASGKTHQLKHHSKQHTNNSLYIPLLTLRATDIIEPNIKTILIDSLDEALDSSDNKNLARNLKEYILRCQNINSETTFIITSRFLEWNNYFKEELETIDNKLRVYSLLALTDEDINLLLDSKSISHIEFWKFINDNHLKPLLGNIMIIQNIIDEFDSYKVTSTNHTSIYENIIQKLLIIKGDDRKRQGVSLEIASSLATYMTLNRKEFITNNELEVLVKELYKIEENKITVSELEILLNSELFNTKENQFSFKQKTLQEYLVAYFIDYKKLDSSKIKVLFAHESRFREEFEEIIIYLTNIQPELFDNFLDFDPFIFRRHPSLVKEQQERLLLSVINQLKHKSFKLYGKWEYLDGTTIIRYKEVSNLTIIIKENIKIESINLLTFIFLLKLLESNYNKELEDYIFEILNSIEEKRNFITYTIINNYAFNIRLLEFLYQNDNLLKKLEKFEYPKYTFEMLFFKSLYGINNQSNYTNINFNKLLKLLESIPESDLKYICPYIKDNDLILWFHHIKDNYNEQEDKNLIWVIYTLLKKKVIDIQQIINFLIEKDIFLYHNNQNIEKLQLKDIDKNFWTFFFQDKEEYSLENALKNILNFYKITIEDIKELIKSYPIEEFPKNYIDFKTIHTDIDKFLMSNTLFRNFMQNLWEEQKRVQLRCEEEWNKKNPEMVKKREVQEKNSQKINKILVKLREESLQNFSTKEDLYNIFYFLSRNIHNDYIEIDKKSKEDLQEQYSLFIEKIKEEFKIDKNYLKLKKESSYSTPTSMFFYLFNILSINERELLLKKKQDYIKLFWHNYRHTNGIEQSYFLEASKRYFKCLVLLSIQSIKFALIQSDNKNVGNFYRLIELFKKLEKHNKDSLSILINFLKTIPSTTYQQLEDKKSLLEILSLDKNSFEFLYQLMLTDEENCHQYLSVLFKMDIEKTTIIFTDLYMEISPKQPLTIQIKAMFGKEVPILNKQYDNPKINIEKIKKFHCLIKALEKNQFKELDLSFLKTLLIDYYEFFKEYDIYDDMNSKISSIWTYLENPTDNNITKHLSILENLSKSTNKALNYSAKVYLEKVHNLQAKKKEYHNSYYKEIFDEEYGVNKNNIYIKDSTLNGSIVDNSKNKTINHNYKEEQKSIKWWIIGSVVALISFGLVWFAFSSWKWGLASAIISFIIMLGFNPKRYYRRMATASFTILGLQLSSFKGLIVIPKNDFAHGFLSIGEHSIPWIGILFGLVTIICLFLDYFENREK